MQRKTIDVTIPHRLTRDEARQRLQSGIARVRGQQFAQFAQVQERWSDYHMDAQVSAMGQTITGRVDVEADCVKLALDLPWLMAVFAEKIRGQIQAEGRKMLEKK